MTTNHLILGLGGTGGKIICNLRRAIYEEFRTKEPLLRVRNGQGGVSEKPHPVKIGYLYVDSSESYMEAGHNSWRIPGDTLQLGLASQMRIRGSNLTSVLENLSAHPNISEWIGSREQWKDILSSSEAEAAGGQKRRLGRFLFACRCKPEDDEGFLAKLRNQVAELRQRTGDTPVTFHICAGLAGGTGSGTLIDVVSLIRKQYGEDSNRVVIYALLPDKDPPHGWARGNYHANGYAALLELNALAVGSYYPWDIAAGTGRVDFRDGTGKPVSPFNGCYVFTNENERGRTLKLHKDPEKDEVAKVVASFLFQKIIMVNTTTWAETLSRLENAENNPEPPVELAPEVKTPERSKRFLTFGIKRLVVPEEEIREYLTYQFARQAILQLQYNHWSNTQQGYHDTPTADAFAEYVADARNHERWCLTDSHRCLEAAILPFEAQEHWKAIDAEWNTVVTGFVQVAKGGEKTSWMATLTRLCEDFVNAKWRSKGVKEFYRMKSNDLAAQAASIVKRIEDDLFAEWVAGRRSMFDLGKILVQLRKLLVDKADVCKRKLNEQRLLVENTAGGQSQVLADIRLNNETWAKIGMASDLLGKRDQVIQSQGEVFKRFYPARHRVEAWAYAGKLTEKIVEEVDRLASTVQTNISILTELVEGESNQAIQDRFVGLKERIEARCKDEEQNVNDQVIKIYEARRVRDFVTRLVGNEDIQRAQTGAVRAAMVEKLGQNAALAKFNQHLNKGVLLDLLETVCTEQAEQAHNQLVAADSRLERVLGNNIVDKLYRDFAGNAMQLGNYIRDLATSAGLYLQFDSLEEKSTSPGSSGLTKDRDFTVIIPRGQEFPQFQSALEAAFKNAHGGAVNFVEGTKSNEITMVAIANLFPLRYAGHVKFLRKNYEQRLGTNPRAELELHTEGNGKQHPPLFLLSGADLPLLPLLLLGRATKLIHEIEDPDTGGKGIYLVTKDDRGRSNDPIFLGENDEAVIDKRDVPMAIRLKASIAALLAKEYEHQAKKEEIKKSLDQVMLDVETRIPNPLDKRRRAYREAINEAEAFLK